jgi:MinD-like ATPase involved in chromosome partitioning or flagellar assembly
MKYSHVNVAVASICGGVGKTTLSNNLLSPQLLDGIVVEVEDWNSSSGVSDLKISSNDFYKVAAQLNVDDTRSFVIDIGASSSQDIIKKFGDLETTRESIDFWVIPVRAGAKQRLDTLKTAQILMDMEIDRKKILIIPSAVTDLKQYQYDFGSLMNTANDTGIYFSPQPILFNEVFDMLKATDKTVFNIVENKPDFAVLKHEARGNEQSLMRLGEQMLIYSLASTAAKNLRAVFEATPIAKNVYLPKEHHGK